MFLVEPGIQKGVVFILVEMLHQLKSSFFMFLPFTGLSTSQIVHDFEVNSVFVDFAFETTQQIRTYIYIYTLAAYLQYLVKNIYFQVVIILYKTYYFTYIVFAYIHHIILCAHTIRSG